MRRPASEAGKYMAWFLAWLIFGFLAAYEAGELALRASNEWGAIRALGYLLASATSLCVSGTRAIQAPRPSMLRAPIVLSLAALLVCFWALYGTGRSTGWVTVAMFGTVYSFGCLLASCVGWFIAWRRQRAKDQ